VEQEERRFVEAAHQSIYEMVQTVEEEYKKK
jgi:hypothetical protein